jgi:hypothetical protein
MPFLLAEGRSSVLQEQDIVPLSDPSGLPVAAPQEKFLLHQVKDALACCNTVQKQPSGSVNPSWEAVNVLEVPFMDDPVPETGDHVQLMPGTRSFCISCTEVARAIQEAEVGRNQAPSHSGGQGMS